MYILVVLQWHIQLLQPLMPWCPLLEECPTLGVLNILFKHLYYCLLPFCNSLSEILFFSFCCSLFFFVILRVVRVCFGC
jgi:hypothetical protein